jgi:hypothetical protein
MFLRALLSNIDCLPKVQEQAEDQVDKHEHVVDCSGMEEVVELIIVLLDDGLERCKRLA